MIFDTTKLALAGLLVAGVVAGCAVALHSAYSAGWEANEAKHARAVREKNEQIEQLNTAASAAYDELDAARKAAAAKALSGDITAIDRECAVRASYPPGVLQQLNAIR